LQDCKFPLFIHFSSLIESYWKDFNYCESILRDGIMRMNKAKMEQDIKKFEDHYVNFGKRVFERLQRDIFKVISSDNFKEWKPD